MVVLLAGVALVVVWLLATVLVYQATYWVSVTLDDYFFNAGYSNPDPSPWHSLVALLATLVWMAVTSNLPL